MLLDSEAPEPPRNERRRYMLSGFDSFDPTPVGNFMVKVSVSANQMVICYWKAAAVSTRDKAKSMKVRMFSDTVKAKDFINKLAEGVELLEDLKQNPKRIIRD